MSTENESMPAELDYKFELKKYGFEIGRIIGDGAFAKVRLATRDIGHKKLTIAAKIIDLKRAPWEYQEKFMPRELLYWPQLAHSNIIKVYSIVKTKPKIYIFTEFAVNGDIVDYITRKGKLSESRTKTWILQLLDALRYCHKRGIAHRDVKCENLLLDNNLRLKLSDFGFCRHCLDDKHKRIMSNTFCGTATYVAPEVIKGEMYNPFRSDIWSVGICLYVMMYNTMPFEASSYTQLFERQMENKLDFLPSIRFSRLGRDFVKKCLNPNPLKRPTAHCLTFHEWVNPKYY